MRTRKPYSNWQELHDSLQYGRKSITNRSYLDCNECARGNLDNVPLKDHLIGLNPFGLLTISDAGFYIATPSVHNHKAVINALVMNLILENIGYRWAPIGSGPGRDYFGVAKKTLPYPSPKFDRAAACGGRHAVRITWDGEVTVFTDEAHDYVPLPEPGKSYPKRSAANRLANYHARILGFPSTSRLWGYKMPPKLTTEQAKNLAEMAKKLGYSSVANAWERGCFITWDKEFGGQVPGLMHKYNLTLAKRNKEDPWSHNPLLKRKQNDYYERVIKQRAI